MKMSWFPVVCFSEASRIRIFALEEIKAENLPGKILRQMKVDYFKDIRIEYFQKEI